MFYQNKTDRYKGNFLSTEILFPNKQIVFDFLSHEIRKGRNINLIARHLPKYETGKNRTAKKTIKPRKGVDKFNWTLPEGKSWVKLNGTLIESGVKKIEVKNGDVVSYPREKQNKTIVRQEFINTWIKEFCKHMGWSLTEYKTFRSKQNSAEQKLSSKAVLSMPKSDFMEFLDKLTSGQRFRVAKSLCNKKDDELIPKEKWNKLGNWYMEWETNQEKVADKLRDAASRDDKEAKVELMKQVKVKGTGLQTIDLLVKLVDGSLTKQQINNTYQSMVEKMDLIANVFPIVDGSGSMGRTLGDRYWGFSDRQQAVDNKYKNIRYFDIAAALCTTFSTRNPVQAFRNTFGWFSSQFKIVGKSKFINESPNPYVDSDEFTTKVNKYNVLSETNTFTQNYEALVKSNPGHVSSTNMFASVEHFVNLVKNKGLHVEDLPQALLYITDNENNSGRSPKQAMELAYSIGWHPLLIFWGIEVLPQGFKNDIKGLPNILLVGGFSESVLSQILRGIKTGSVNPEDELWSIYDDKRYSVIK